MGELIVSNIEVFERLEVVDAIWKAAEAVETEVQLNEMSQGTDRLRDSTHEVRM